MRKSKVAFSARVSYFNVAGNIPTSCDTVYNSVSLVTHPSQDSEMPSQGFVNALRLAVVAQCLL